MGSLPSETTIEFSIHEPLTGDHPIGGPGEYRMLLGAAVNPAIKYPTRGIIALCHADTGRHGDGRYSGILHYDDQPVAGPFDRIEEMARTFATFRGRMVYFAVKMPGGGVCGNVYPKEN